VVFLQVPALASIVGGDVAVAFGVEREPFACRCVGVRLAAVVILLGCVALRVGEGRRMEWDGPNMKCTNLPELNQWVKREYRKGWKV